MNRPPPPFFQTSARLPLVSIVMTTYQHAGFVGAALDSALVQTYPNFEIVVADDGSTDGTWEILQTYGQRHPGRVIVLPKKENGGIEGMAENARRVFLAGRGKYIAILEGDDLYFPEKIERQVAWMEADPRRVLCGHDVEVFDSDTRATLYRYSEHHPLCSGTGPERFTVNIPFATPSVMIRAASMPSHVLHPRLKIAGDWMLFFECLSGGGTFGFVEGVHARYRRHANNLTSRLPEIHFADHMTTLDLMEAQCPNLAHSCRRTRASILYGRGVNCLREGDVAGARIYLWRSVQQRARFKSTLAAFIALLPRRLAPPIAQWFANR